jgi:hypothetical protein
MNLRYRYPGTAFKVTVRHGTVHPVIDTPAADNQSADLFCLPMGVIHDNGLKRTFSELIRRAVTLFKLKP